MAEAIGNNEVSTPCQGRNNADVGEVAATEGQGSFLVFQLGDFFFEEVVDFKIPAHQPCRTCTGPVHLEVFPAGSNDCGMFCQGEIVI